MFDNETIPRLYDNLVSPKVVFTLLNKGLQKKWRF